jgi:hypothetical protein
LAETLNSYGVGICPQEDRRRSKDKVGAGEGGSEEGGCLRVDSMLGLIGVALGLFPQKYRCVHAKGFDAK